VGLAGAEHQRLEGAKGEGRGEGHTTGIVTAQAWAPVNSPERCLNRPSNGRRKQQYVLSHPALAEGLTY
jgi:hypothetical protein